MPWEEASAVNGESRSLLSGVNADLVLEA